MIALLPSGQGIRRWQTADDDPFGHDLLVETAKRINNGVKVVNLAVYDGASKPPGTIKLK